jgi:hypothetical protein
VGEAVDPVQAYQNALFELHRAVGDFDEMRRELQSTAVAMIHGWENVIVAGIEEQFPPHFVNSKTLRTINPRDYPTVEQIAESLLAAHRAREKALQAWEQIAPDRREGLPGPPE